MMFSKKLRSDPSALEGQILFLERSHQPGSFLHAEGSLEGRMPTVNSSPLWGLWQVRLTELGVLARGAVPAPFPKCWKQDGTGQDLLLLHSPHSEDLFSAFLAFPSVSWMVFPFNLPCSPSSGVGPACTQLWQCVSEFFTGIACMDCLGRWAGTNSQAVTRLLLMDDFAACSCIPVRSNGSATSSASPLSWVSVTHKVTPQITEWLQVRRRALLYESLILPSLSGVKSKPTQPVEDSHWF